MDTYIIEYDDLVVSHKYDETVVINSEYIRHYHPFYEILLIKQGQLDFVVENQVYNVGNNDILIIPPTTYHFTQFHNLNNYERYVLKFDKRYIHSHIEKLIGHIGIHHHVDNPHVLRLFDDLDRYAKYGPMTQQAMFATTICQIILECYHTNKPPLQGRQVINAEMDKILSYINNNLSHNITLDTLAKMFYHSKTWIYNSFVASLKTPPMEYVRGKRIALANMLISQGHKPTRIFEMCGYSDYSTFYRSYIAEMGHPPSKLT